MTTDNQQPQPKSDTARLEVISMVFTGALIVAAIVIAVQTSDYETPLKMIVFSFAVGGLGGLVHEVAQSGGKIMFFERKIDGMYLGTLSGMILGGVAGILAARGLQTDAAARTNVFYECFLAGMALKGIVEASTGAPLPPGQQDVTATQAALAASMSKSGASDVRGGTAISPLALPDLSAPPAQVA
jgi:hypothetical protein